MPRPLPTPLRRHLPGLVLGAALLSLLPPAARAWVVDLPAPADLTGSVAAAPYDAFIEVVPDGHDGAGDLVVVGTFGGQWAQGASRQQSVLRISREFGIVLWRRDFPLDVSSARQLRPPSTGSRRGLRFHPSGDILLFFDLGAGAGPVMRIDAATGRTRWQWQPPSDGAAFTGANGWVVSAAGEIFVLVHSRTIFGLPGEVVELSYATGAEEGRLPLPGAAPGRLEYYGSILAYDHPEGGVVVSGAETQTQNGADEIVRVRGDGTLAWRIFPDDSAALFSTRLPELTAYDAATDAIFRTVFTTQTTAEQRVLRGADGSDLGPIAVAGGYDNGLDITGDGRNPILGRDPVTGDLFFAGMTGRPLNSAYTASRREAPTGAVIWSGPPCALQGCYPIGLALTGAPPDVIAARESVVGGQRLATTLGRLRGSDGAVLWETELAEGSRFPAASLVGDHEGNIVHVGAYDGASPPQPDLRIVKLAPDGTDYQGTALCPNAIVEPGEACDDGNAVAGDGCDACTSELGWQCPTEPGGACAPICGDLLTRGSEQCDNGGANGTAGDACDARCRLRRIESGTVPAAGGCVSTAADPSSCTPDGATPASPVAAGVRVPDLGPGGQGLDVAVSVESALLPKPTGFVVVDKQVDIDLGTGESPPAGVTPSNPLVFTFVVEGSLAPADADVAGLVVFRNGTAVGTCTGSGAAPDPCVASRSRIAGGPNDGDVQVTVRTTRASDWAVASRVTLTGEQAACRIEVRKGIEKYFAARLSAARKCLEKAAAGKATPPCPDLKAEGKLARTRVAIEKKLAKKCSDAIIAGLEIAGPCESAATLAGLTTCAWLAADAAAGSLIDAEYAMNGSAIVDPAELKCQVAVSKSFGGYVAKKVKLSGVCRQRQDQGKAATCPDARTAANLAKAAAKAGQSLGKSCTDTAVRGLALDVFGGPCSTLAPAFATVADLAECELAAHDAAADALLGTLP